MPVGQATKDQREMLRAALVKARPEWEGRIWVYPGSVTVRGIGNIHPWYGWSREALASLLRDFDEMARLDGKVA